MSARLQRLGIATVAVAALWAVAALYPIQAAAPNNPVTLPFEDRVDSLKVAPQGWAFFTRSPREPYLLPYVRASSGQWESAHVGQHAHPKHAFGLNRASRAQGVEMGLLQSEIDEDDWRDCDGAPEDCLPALPVTVTAENESPRPTLCGDVALLRQEPVPWAWSRGSDPPEMPGEAVRMEVACH